MHTSRTACLWATTSPFPRPTAADPPARGPTKIGLLCAWRTDSMMRHQLADENRLSGGGRTLGKRRSLTHSLGRLPPPPTSDGRRPGRGRRGTTSRTCLGSHPDLDLAGDAGSSWPSDATDATTTTADPRLAQMFQAWHSPPDRIVCSSTGLASARPPGRVLQVRLVSILGTPQQKTTRRWKREGREGGSKTTTPRSGSLDPRPLA